jgi:cyclic pyranopterin phosphate synthase
LHSVERKRVYAKHALAQEFPKVIRPDIETVSIALTSKCNLRCKGCSYGRDFMPLEQLSLAKIKEILKSTKAMNIQYVWFYGGEAAMVKSSDLIEMIRYATELGLTSTLGTNGVMLDDKLMKELYGVGLRRIAIGLYGISENYEQYVDRKDVFGQLDLNIESIRKKYPTVSVSLGWLLMKPTCTVEAVDDLVEFAQKHRVPFGINLVHYDFPYFVTKDEESTLLLNAEDLSQIMEVQERLIAIKRKYPELINNSLTGINSISEWLLKKETITIPCYRYDYLWIAANGEVRVCQKAALLGNVHEKALDDIIYTKDHTASARDCFALNCTGCNVDWDDRTTSTPSSRKQFSLS